MRPCSAGRLVRAHGPSGGSVWQDPQASGSFHPLPSLVWAGSVLQQLSCPRGWDKPARGKGVLGPWPPAPPPALLWNLMYLNTHTNLDGPTRFRTQAQSGGGSKKKKKKKIDLVASSLPWCFGRFPVSAASPGLQGCPVPGGPEIQAFGSGSWQMRYLFVTERREVGEKSSGKSSSSLALVECETPGQHP